MKKQVPNFQAIYGLAASLKPYGAEVDQLVERGIKFYYASAQNFYRW